MDNNLQNIRDGNNALVKQEAFLLPDSAKEFLSKGSTVKLPIAKLATMGSAFSSLAGQLRSVVGTAGGEGYYYVSFNGVAGALAKANDGSGYLGTVLNNGIAGQSRLTPVGKTMASFNPATVCMAAAVYSIDQKLDRIEKMQAEILSFLEQDKEAQIRTDIKNLMDITSNYKFNWDNEKYVSAKLNLVQDIKREARKNVDFYEGQINKISEKKDLVHLSKNVKSRSDALNHAFNYYRMSVQIYSFASFLEVMLIGNFNAEFLQNVSTDLEEQSYQYRILYTKCYEQLSDYAKSAMENHVVKGIGKISKAAGSTIAKIPVISNGQVDETLIEAGTNLQKYTGNQESTLSKFTENKDTAIPTFIENVKMVGMYFNQSEGMVFDYENVYILNAA